MELEGGIGNVYKETKSYNSLCMGVNIYGCVMSIGLGQCFKSNTMVQATSCNVVTEFAV